MRAVVQRVRSASVSADGQPAGRIDSGLLVYLGVAAGDGPADIEYIVTKVQHLRIFADEHGKMNRSLVETGGAVLVVSQFTLHGDVRKGRRPAFDGAEKPEIARGRYLDALAAFRTAGLPVEAGVFQADMQVTSVNDGPVTILLDSRRCF